MIKTMLWPGMQGVVIAALLAALMSTVSGALNSIATLCSYDIYKRFKPDADDRHLVRVGRLATFVAMCVAVLWSMVIGALGETIFQAMVDVFPVVAPPTAVVFLWGVFWRRTSAKASLWTLIGGSAFGLIIYVLKMLDRFDYIQLEDISTHLASFLAINSLFMAFILFVAESVFIVLVSLAVPHQHTEESAALVWKSPLEALKGQNTWKGLLDYRVLSLLLVLTMVGLYIGFSVPETYYPLSGKVTLNGKPVVGAYVFLDTEDDTLDGNFLRTGLDGTFRFGTTDRAGGAPAGTTYRVRVEPGQDFVVRMANSPGEIEEVLACVPAGTQVEEQVTGQTKRFVVKATGESIAEANPEANVRLIRATSVPEKFQQFESSGITMTVPEAISEQDIALGDSSRVGR
jgi:hypothetical protein